MCGRRLQKKPEGDPGLLQHTNEAGVLERPHDTCRGAGHPQSPNPRACRKYWPTILPHKARRRAADASLSSCGALGRSPRVSLSGRSHVSTTNSAAILLSRYIACRRSVRWTFPSGWWLGLCAHCLSICPRTPRSASARATACARKRAFGNPVAAWPKLAPDQLFGYI